MDMRDAARELLTSGGSCVLATVSAAGAPHASLMAYVCDPECREIVMASPGESRKWRNILENRRVSVLVDTRCPTAAPCDGCGSVRAVTVTGEHDPVLYEAEKRRYLGLLGLRHERLRGIFDAPGVEVIRIRARGFQLQDGPYQTHFFEHLVHEADFTED